MSILNVGGASEISDSESSSDGEYLSAFDENENVEHAAENENPEIQNENAETVNSADSEAQPSEASESDSEISDEFNDNFGQRRLPEQVRSSPELVWLKRLSLEIRANLEQYFYVEEMDENNSNQADSAASAASNLKLRYRG